MKPEDKAVVQQAQLMFSTMTVADDIDWVRSVAELQANALRELLEQPEQQPVGEVSGHDWSTGLLYRDLEPGTPLYTTPPAQPAAWVGLTNEEREAILDREFRQWWSRHDAVCRAIEAKLKEKNT